MVTPTAGAVVLVRFPFSDLSQTKLRPAEVKKGVGSHCLGTESEILAVRITKLLGQDSTLRTLDPRKGGLIKTPDPFLFAPSSSNRWDRYVHLQIHRLSR